MARQSGTDLDDVQGAGRGDKKPQISDLIPVYKFPEKKWVTMRLIEVAYTYAGYWVKTKKKDGSHGKFYVDCSSYDPKTQQRDPNIYDPYRDVQATQSDVDPKDQLIQYSRQAFFNVISRASQKQEPSKLAKHTASERKTGFKEKDSDSWTPIVPVRFTASVAAKIKEQSGLNVHEIKGQTKSFPVTHPKYGCDIRVYYDSTKAPADQYQISIGKATPLTEEELAYLKWDLSDLVQEDTEEKVRADFESWAKRMGVKVKIAKKSKNVDLDDEDEEDDEDDEPKSKKKPAAKSSKKKPVDDDDDEDEDEGFDDDEEDEDEPKSKKKSAGKSSKKKKPVDDEEDEEDDDFDDEDDEDDEPKSKKKPAAKGKKKPVDDEDEDEDDFDDEDDEDEDDEPKSKKKPAKAASKSSKKKPVDDDEDDFGDDDEDEEDSDDEDEEDDEDDEPVKKKSSKAPAKKGSSKSSKKKVVEDDDEDEDLDEDEDEEEDEDDEPVRKPSKSKTKSRR